MNIKKITVKSWFILLLVVFVAPFLFVAQGQTKIQAYYSGDAVSYQGQIIIASANTGYLEVFALQNKQLAPLIKAKIYNGAYNTYSDYSDVKLSVEGSNLYVYATSAFTVYKYNFSDLAHLTLVASATNSYWNWYDRIDRYGDTLGLVGKNGVDFINANLQTVVSAAFVPTEKYSLRGDSQFLFGITDNKLQIYDRTKQEIVQTIPLNYTSAETNRKIYFNAADQTVFVIDDYYMKKFSVTTGQLLASFRHLDAAGYEAESTASDSKVYFSNGLGVVALGKADLKVKNYVYTTDLSGPQGWAMGLKLLNTPTGDVLVVFNASNILVLDQNLHKIAAVRATETTVQQATEALFLNYDHNFGAAGAAINLNGGGYWPNEKLTIAFGSVTATTVTADNHGRFTAKVIVPNLAAQRLDIKVTGVSSQLGYSTSFDLK
jgi:WD40 repeat protein